MFVGNPLENRSRQPLYDDPEIRAKVKAKLKNVIEKGYIEMVDIKLVEALMFMFHVPKGESDIRMVYDGSKSGLNEALYSPWFHLPTVDSMVRWVVAVTNWCSTIDPVEHELVFNDGSLHNLRSRTIESNRLALR